MSKLYDLLSAMCGKIKKPDWNQNNETAPDYVKNRPFYTGDPVETVLVEESTLPFKDVGRGLYISNFPSDFEATAGETYTVFWDGEAYECTCVDFNGMLAIGNLSILASGPDTGEPFTMLGDGLSITIGTADTSASHTVSISGFAQEIVKIDKKYLPDSDKTISKTIFYYSESSKMVYKDPSFTEGLTSDEVLEAFVSTGITLYLECDGYADVVSLLKNVNSGQHGLSFYHSESGMMTANNAVP